MASISLVMHPLKLLDTDNVLVCTPVPCEHQARLQLYDK